MARQDPLARLLEELRGKYGEYVAVPASELPPIKRLSTGAAPLDAILDGGWPEGRVVEVWGPQGAGKTTLCLASAAAVQKAFPGEKTPVAWFDQENTLDPRWAKTLGVDCDRLLYHPPMAGEDVGDLALQYVKSKVRLVVVDSAVAMVPEKTLLKGTGEHTYSPVASLLSTWLPKVVVLQGLSPTVVLLTNQVRDRVGFVLGDKVKSPGGRALEHADSLKLKLWRRRAITAPGRDADGKATDVQVGYVMAVKVVKSKVGGEGRECRLQVTFGRGIVDAQPDGDDGPDEDEDA